MAKEKKKKYVQMTSPAGVAVYPWLNKPDTKFNAAGIYSVTLKLEGAEADTLIEALAPLYQAALDAAKEESGKKKIKEAGVPWKLAEDEEGNELDGVYLFNFKMKAQLTDKAGSVIDMRPALFDAARKPLPAKTAVWGGSKIKVAFELVPFFVAAVGAGISLRMKAVQVLELVSGGQRDAESYGFDEEDGYVAEDVAADAGSDTTPATQDAEDGGEEDF